jgi:serine/threonine-protein kinase
VDADRWKQVDDLLQSALQLLPDARDSFLRQVCAGDPPLEQEVRSLLLADEEAQGFLDQAAVQPQALAVAFSEDEQPLDLLSGQTISHYRVLRRLASGGMGVVYEAEDIRLGRHVALKLLLESQANDKGVLRFEQEAHAIASLNHPNICTVFEIEAHEAKPVIVMELLEGETLKQRLRGGAVPLRQIVQWGIEIAGALEAAHARGVIHRDIKSANLFITDRGAIKVLDFGLAKLTVDVAGGRRGDDESLTTFGVIPGTTPYMSPEQVRGDALDGRTDLFSLGAVLHELATGRRPFEEKNLAMTLDAVLNKTPLPVSAINPDLPPQLERIVAKALEKDRDRRYQTASDIRSDLSALQRAGLDVQPPSATPAEPFSGASRDKTPDSDSPAALVAGNRWHRSAATRFGPVALAMALMAIFGAYLWNRQPRQPPVAERLMLAVLPFGNLTGDPDQDYLSDGLTEEMIATLGNLDPQRLGVIARTSVMGYRDGATRLEQIGRELGVRYVLGGSLRRDSDKLRITVKLIDVNDQTQVWTRQFDRQVTHVLVVQSEIAQQVADEIHLTIGGGNRAAAAQPILSFQKYEGYESYLKGQYFFSKRNVRAFRQAIRYFQQAISNDPSDARAYAGLADSYMLLSAYSLSPQAEIVSDARAAAFRAITLDGSLPEAHSALALVVQNSDWDWQTAEKEFRAAIELNPNNATAHHWYAEHLMWRGRFDDALAEIERARRLDPLSLIIGADKGAILYYSRQYDRAIDQFRAVLDLDPAFPRAQLIASAYVEKQMLPEAVAQIEKQRAMGGDLSYWSALAYVYARAGQVALTRGAVDELKRLSRQGPVDPAVFVWAYAAMGDKELAFTWLERAYAERSNAIPALKVGPGYDPLRGDPRFDDLLRRVGLSD